MAVKLILTQIMKNEEHVAERMLDSIKSIVDGICVIDTGSTDNSIDVVKKWGEKNNIETYVFEREFDTYENSRNYSFEKAREIFLNRGDNNTYYNFWLDFDEELIIDHNKFDKKKLNKDLYMFNVLIDGTFYTRNECVRLDGPFEFYGPVHEFIISKEKNITSGSLEGVKVKVHTDGGSWKGDIAEKYKKHAFILEEYIDKDRSDPRWIFYLAQSYHDSANVKNNWEDNVDRLKRSMRYYKERVSRKDGYSEERFFSQYRIGTIMKILEEPWNLTHQELLKAYSMDPLRGEPIKTIIDYYLQVSEWNNAYLYSKFALMNYHQKNPYPKRLLFVNTSLYEWKFLEVYAAASFYTGRFEEAKKSFNEILEIYNKKPELFNDSDVEKINKNSQFFK